MKTIERAKSQRAFRLWKDNAERVDWAVKAGINASEVVNQVLSDHLRQYLEKASKVKRAELEKALSAPVP